MSANYPQPSEEDLQRLEDNIDSVRIFGSYAEAIAFAVAGHEGLCAAIYAVTDPDDVRAVRKALDGFGFSVERYADAIGVNPESVLDLVIANAIEEDRELHEGALELVQEAVLFGVPAFETIPPTLDELGLEEFREEVAGLQYKPGAAKRLTDRVAEIVTQARKIDPASIQNGIEQLEQITGVSRTQVEAVAAEKAGQLATTVQQKVLPRVRSFVDQVTDAVNGVIVMTQLRRMQQEERPEGESESDDREDRPRE